MSVRIGHSSIDERGQAKGGQAGDQTQKEICVRSWYSKPWTVMLRPKSASVAEKSAQACEAGCANDRIGYDQNQRNTLHTEAKKVGYDLSKIATPCECDCSSFMTVCAIAGGVTGLEYSGNAPTTSTMVDAFTKTGQYQKYTDTKYLNSDEYLRRGDILISPGHHTVMVLDNGTKATTTSSGYPMRGVDVSVYQKNVDYQRLKNAGVQFAIIKVINKSNQKDPMFETHWAGFTKVGVPCDVYNYSYATTTDKAVEDAKAVIAALNGRKCTVYLDLEDKCTQGIGEKLVQIANAYQQIIESAGCKFAIYSGLSYVKSFLKPYVNKLNCKQLWCARYYNGYNTMYIDSPLNESKKPLIDGFDLIGWQYTSSGQIDGYNGKIDMSIMYKAVEKKISTVKSGYVYNCNSLTVRNAPDKSGKPIGYLTCGTHVLIYETDKNTGFCRIHPTESQWSSGKYIDIR